MHGNIIFDTKKTKGLTAPSITDNISNLSYNKSNKNNIKQVTDSLII